MNWSGRGPDERRGYHHGNLREALIKAALDLIAKKGPAGFTLLPTPRAPPGQLGRTLPAFSATATR